MRNTTDLALAFDAVLQHPWFAITGTIGILAFSISGVIIARTERYSLFGAFVLAALPAVGGGMVRDFLVNRPLPASVASPVPLLMVMGVVAASHLFLRLAERLAGRSLVYFDLVHLYVRTRGRISPRMALEVADAVGLAAFTLTGVGVAFSFAPDPILLWAPLLAGLTGAGGGILRDMLRPGAGNPMLKRAFYAEIAILWAFALTAFLLLLPEEEAAAVMAEAMAFTLAGVLATRLLVVRFALEAPKF